MPTNRLVPKLQAGGSADWKGWLAQRTVRNITTPVNNKLAPSGLAPAPTLAAPQPQIKTHGGMNAAAGIAGGIGGVADLAADTVQSFAKPGKTNTWGITEQNYKANTASDTLKTAGKWASTGAAIGSLGGPLGTAIGAGVGLLGGAIAGLLGAKKKVKADKKEYKDNTQLAYEDYNQKAAAQQYAALAKHGAKLSITNALSGAKRNAISYKSRTFKRGGKLDKLGEVNIIPSGTLHKENNNLGNKDKGLPIINEGGKKIFEVEREELILRLKTTKEVEALVNKYKKSNNSRHLVDLGKLLTKEITTNTHDFSGKFGMEVK